MGSFGKPKKGQCKQVGQTVLQISRLTALTPIEAAVLKREEE